MADKRIQDLTPASSVGTADRFVLEQSGQAKSLTGQVLINDLATALDGHGGIVSITYTAPVSPSLSGTLTITLADESVVTMSITNGRGITGISKSSSGLTDTYTLSYNDGTTSTFSVTNGKEISSVIKTGTADLTDIYTITYNDGTSDTFNVTNGRGIDDIEWSETGTQGDGMTHTGTISYNDDSTSTIIFHDGVKGDTGEQTYVWFKWAQNFPTQDSDMQNSVAPYIGIYSGFSSTAPTAYTDYAWYQYKGDKGDTGDTGDYIDPVVFFGTSTAAATEPQTWYNSPSSISYAAGNFIWQKTQYTLHNAQTVQSTEKKIIGYIGQNGSGSGTVTQITFNGTAFQDDGTGNVPMTVDAADVGAIADPENKANGQVLTYDSSADEWVAATPTTGDVNTVNNVGVTAGTTNIQLYGTAIPMSSTDNTSVKDAIPLASSATPQPLGTAAAGSGTTWARADHVHAKPSRTDLGLGAVALEDVVPISEGGTGATNYQAALANLNAYDLSRGVNQIPNNSNIDNYTSLGVYYVPNAASAATMTNGPVTWSGYKLVVEQMGGGSSLRQTAYLTSVGTLYRRKDGGAWSDWVSLITSVDTKTVTQLTLTYTTNSLVTSTNFNRLYAYRKNGMLFLMGNMLVSAGAATGDSFVEIGTISGWSAVDSYYCTVAPQGNNGTAIVTVYITNTGSIQLFCPTAVTSSSTWYRFAACIPASSSY